MNLTDSLLVWIGFNTLMINAGIWYLVGRARARDRAGM